MPQDIETLDKGQRARRKALAEALINDADRDNDGFYSAEELLALPSLKKAALEDLIEGFVAMGKKTQSLREAGDITQPAVLTALIPDRLLMDRARYRVTIAQQMNLTAEEIDAALKKVVPRGMADLRVSDVCGDPDLHCARVGDKVMINAAGVSL